MRSPRGVTITTLGLCPSCNSIFDFVKSGMAPSLARVRKGVEIGVERVDDYEDDAP
jgi:hypothetical protein